MTFLKEYILVIKYVAATLLTANKKQNCNKLPTDSLGEREFQFSFSEQHAERRFCHHFSHPSVLDSRVIKTDEKGALTSQGNQEADDIG